jgi:hypothetical protein
LTENSPIACVGKEPAHLPLSATVSSGFDLTAGRAARLKTGMIRQHTDRKRQETGSEGVIAESKSNRNCRQTAGLSVANIILKRCRIL